MIKSLILFLSLAILGKNSLSAADSTISTSLELGSPTGVALSVSYRPIPFACVNIGSNFYVSSSFSLSFFAAGGSHLPELDIGSTFPAIGYFSNEWIRDNFRAIYFIGIGYRYWPENYGTSFRLLLNVHFDSRSGLKLWNMGVLTLAPVIGIGWSF